MDRPDVRTGFPPCSTTYLAVGSDHRLQTLPVQGPHRRVRGQCRRLRRRTPPIWTTFLPRLRRSLASRRPRARRLLRRGRRGQAADGWVGWISGESLRNHVAATSSPRARISSARPARRSARGSCSTPGSSRRCARTLVLELGAPVALLGGIIRTTWVVATWRYRVRDLPLSALARGVRTAVPPGTAPR